MLSAPELQFVTKTVITRNIKEESIGNIAVPTLVLIEASEIITGIREIIEVLYTFSPRTKIIVLFKQKDDLIAMFKILTKLSFYNSVYLDGSTNRVFAAYRSSLHQVSKRRDLHGKPITFADRRNMYGNFAAMIWVKETALFLNATTLASVHNCHGTHAKLYDECYTNYVNQNKVDIDLTAYAVKNINLIRFRYLVSSKIGDMVILVPKTPLNIFQLFTKPFSWQVWATLVVLLIAVDAIHRALPSIFRNDPILLVVCGFEDYNLHGTSFTEKIALHSLMILMFFVICAYETKLVSMMISKPATREIHTIRDLVESGVKIKANLLTNPHLLENPFISDSLVNSSETIFQMDLTHAHIVQRTMAELTIPKYYDPVNRLHRYSILDQTLGIKVKAYVFAIRSSLVEVFEYTQAIFIESGIYDRWSINYMKAATERNFECLGIAQRQRNDSLYFSDFYPAWVAILFGFGLSVAVFCFEWFLYVIAKQMLRKLQCTVTVVKLSRIWKRSTKH